MIRLTDPTLVAIAFFTSDCVRSEPVARPEQPAQKGVASFYGDEFAGKKTASGETFKPNEMTAASRTLPLGSRVEVTNQETGQSAKVRINDRGPYVGGRVIDLTPKAAKHVGISPDDGVARVSVKPISPGYPASPAE